MGKKIPSNNLISLLTVSCCYQSSNENVRVFFCIFSGSQKWDEYHVEQPRANLNAKISVVLPKFRKKALMHFYSTQKRIKREREYTFFHHRSFRQVFKSLKGFYAKPVK